MNRLLLPLLLSISVAGCDLVGDIFQAGFVGGIILVVLIVIVIGWIIRRFRG